MLLAHAHAAAPAVEAVARHAIPPFDWSDFELHWSTIYGILAMSALYAWTMGVVRRRRRLAARGDGWRVTSFVAAQLTLFLALNGPMDELSDTYLFSAHMVQHLLLTELWAPLTLLALPGWLQGDLLGLGAPGRWLERLTRLLPAFLLFNVVFTAWHLPLLYDWMVADERVHIVAHLLFMATSILLWWPMIESAPGRRPVSAPVKMLYLALVGVAMMPVAGFISMATVLIYPAYVAAPRVFGLTPLADQQLGGLIMWVPGSVAFWAALTAVYFRWALAKEREELAGLSPQPAPGR
jgi:putative membrane protein